MAEFLVRLADERGHVTEQIESARSEAEVRERLVQQGLLVVRVKPRGLVGGGSLRPSGRRKIKLAGFVIFNQQMVTLLRAGLPILSALELLSKQQKDEDFRALLHDVRDGLRAGKCCPRPSKIRAFSLRSTPRLCWPERKAAIWKRY